jgi:hypothetical protein
MAFVDESQVAGSHCQNEVAASDEHLREAIKDVTGLAGSHSCEEQPRTVEEELIVAAEVFVTDEGVDGQQTVEEIVAESETVEEIVSSCETVADWLVEEGTSHNQPMTVMEEAVIEEEVVEELCAQSAGDLSDNEVIHNTGTGYSSVKVKV